ncbi:hypothetical protein [Dysgonomonas massiliensis]|uniref:hypothetical protein n=1 Tax=Dysgonomonas massiliensis TaxID=2040292 RepID=UPI000C793979|nr:hypothetical protein [Dysgonomonas massiliensis]
MKKLFFILTLALVSFGLSAQDGLKGTWFAGGEISYSKAGDAKSFTILPVAGTFITPDIAIGAGVGYTKTELPRILEGVAEINKTDAFIFQPLVRKYWNITGPIYLFGQVAAPMVFGDDTSIGLNVSPGIDFIVNSWMTLETSFTLFGFNYTKYDAGGNSWNIGFDPFSSKESRKIGQLSVGVKFLF